MNDVAGSHERAFSPLPVRRVQRSQDAPAAAWAPAGEAGWPASLPAVRQLLQDGLDLGALTVLVGENGSGKSTLVEAVAMAFGLSAEGGSTGAQHRTRHTESELADWLTLVRGGGRASRWGFFLRAETMHGFYSYLEDNPSTSRRSLEPRFHRMSHGESFLALLDTSRFSGPGFFALDEPESALSFAGALALVAHLHDISQRGDAQALVATHSPVIASVPGARLLEVGDWGLRESSWEDLDLVRNWRSYLQDPHRYLRHLLD